LPRNVRIFKVLKYFWAYLFDQPGKFHPEMRLPKIEVAAMTWAALVLTLSFAQAQSASG
jgi:hypothetical protein